MWFPAHFLGILVNISTERPVFCFLLHLLFCHRNKPKTQQKSVHSLRVQNKSFSFSLTTLATWWSSIHWIQSIHPKGDQSWVLIGRTDAEADTPVLWPPDVKSWLIGKDPDAGKDWEQEEKGMPEDEMVGWHHRLDGHEFGWTLGVADGQGDLVCCSSWGHKESDTTEQLNWTELNECELIWRLKIHAFLIEVWPQSNVYNPAYFNLHYIMGWVSIVTKSVEKHQTGLSNIQLYE